MCGTGKMKIDIETEKGHLRSGRSTRPSGCMTLQIGWLHGGANWHTPTKMVTERRLRIVVRHVLSEQLVVAKRAVPGFFRFIGEFVGHVA